MDYSKSISKKKESWGMHLSIGGGGGFSTLSMENGQTYENITEMALLGVESEKFSRYE